MLILIFRVFFIISFIIIFCDATMNLESYFPYIFVMDFGIYIILKLVKEWSEFVDK
ncbi:hypothetical protein A5814_002778 [Enterococcus faecium]|nr:hypothetical protein A5814_002778 [Enterococcus faecium]